MSNKLPFTKQEENIWKWKWFQVKLCLTMYVSKSTRESLKYVSKDVRNCNLKPFSQEQESQNN